MNLIQQLASGLKSFNAQDNTELDERKYDPEFWALVDKATEKHEYNTKAGLLRLLYNLYDSAEDDKLQLNILKFIYEMSVSNKIEEDSLNVVITKVEK